MAEQQQHPITPPPELVEHWYQRADNSSKDVVQEVANQSALWGADRRLEAVCEYIAEEGKWFATPQFRLAELRAAMDPKPTSLAEQGLAALKRQAARSVTCLAGTNDCEAIRCALERLQQLEQENNGH